MCHCEHVHKQPVLSVGCAGDVHAAPAHLLSKPSLALSDWHQVVDAYKTAYLDNPAFCLAATYLSSQSQSLISTRIPGRLH
jgi:hypothetical protein